MRNVVVRDVFRGLLVAAGALGAALVGLAVGQALRSGDIASISQHPMFHAGARCLSSSAICGVLLLAAIRR